MNLCKWNEAATSKLLWDVAREKDRIWVQWIHSYYIKHRDIETVQIPRNASWVVRKFLSSRKHDQLIQQGSNSIQELLKKAQQKGKFSVHMMYHLIMPYSFAFQDTPQDISLYCGWLCIED